MAQNVYDMVVTQFTMNLKALKNCLLSAREFSKERSFDEDSYLTLKAAPDMFPFIRQIQITTDIAKGTAGRLAGKTAPVFDDKETTMEELLGRIDKTIHFLSEFKPTDFSSYQEKTISFPWMKGFFMNGKDYFESHAIPNFFFHATTAYVLLRNSGVNLGKKDFLGEQNWQKQ